MKSGQRHSVFVQQLLRKQNISKQKWSNTVKGVKMSQRDNLAEFITSASVLIRRNNQVPHIFMYLARWRTLVDVVIIDSKGGRRATLCKVHQSLCRELGGDKCG